MPTRLQLHTLYCYNVGEAKNHNNDVCSELNGCTTYTLCRYIFRKCRACISKYMVLCTSYTVLPDNIQT